MNNKIKMVTFCDLGAIVEKLKNLEATNESGRELLDIRLQLATIWINQAKKMQRFKNLHCNLYRYYAIEEECILSAIEVFDQIRYSLSSRQSKS